MKLRPNGGDVSGMSAAGSFEVYGSSESSGCEDGDPRLEGDGEYLIKIEAKGEKDGQTGWGEIGSVSLTVYTADYILITEPEEDICVVATSSYSSDLSTKQCEAIAYWNGHNCVKEDGEGDDIECPDHKIEWGIRRGHGTISQEGLYTGGSEPGKTIVVASGSEEDTKEFADTELEIVNPQHEAKLEKGEKYVFKASIKGGTDDLTGKFTENITPKEGQQMNSITIANENTANKVVTADVTFDELGEYDVNCYLWRGAEGTGIGAKNTVVVDVIDANEFQVEMRIKENFDSEEDQTNDMLCVSSGEDINTARLYVKLSYAPGHTGDGETKTVYFSVAGNDTVTLKKKDGTAFDGDPRITLDTGQSDFILIESGNTSSVNKDDINVQASIQGSEEDVTINILEDTEDFTVVGAEIKDGDDIEEYPKEAFCLEKSLKLQAKVTPDIGLNDGDYRWRIIAQNDMVKIRGPKNKKEAEIKAKKDSHRRGCRVRLQIKVAGEWCSGFEHKFDVVKLQLIVDKIFWPMNSKLAGKSFHRLKATGKPSGGTFEWEYEGDVGTADGAVNGFEEKSSDILLRQGISKPIFYAGSPTGVNDKNRHNVIVKYKYKGIECIKKRALNLTQPRSAKCLETNDPVIVTKDNIFQNQVYFLKKTVKYRVLDQFGENLADSDEGGNGARGNGFNFHETRKQPCYNPHNLNMRVTFWNGKLKPDSGLLEDTFYFRIPQRIWKQIRNGVFFKWEEHKWYGYCKPDGENQNVENEEVIQLTDPSELRFIKNNNGGTIWYNWDDNVDVQ